MILALTQDYLSTMDQQAKSVNDVCVIVFDPSSGHHVQEASLAYRHMVPLHSPNKRC